MNSPILAAIISSAFGRAPTKLGPRVPLNEAGKAEQARHCAAVDRLVPEMHRARLAYEIAKKAVDDEQDRWYAAMRIAHPELAGVDCDINDDGTYQAEIHDEPPAPPKPPEWVQQMIDEGKA